jgi:hypothetical protein
MIKVYYMHVQKYHSEYQTSSNWYAAIKLNIIKEMSEKSPLVNDGAIIKTVWGAIILKC